MNGRLLLPADFAERVHEAVGYFWGKRDAQGQAQGAQGMKDAGARAKVTGGKQMDGLIGLFRDLLLESGIPAESVFLDRALELPGFFRPTKRWDLLVVHGGRLLAVLEAKSQVGSFGNNCNNRAEEAVGSATDIWTAYREGAFGQENPPWVGYLFLLEDDAKTQVAIRVAEPHYPVFAPFKDASYSVRYQELLKRLVMEKLYSSACLLVSPAGDLDGGRVREPCEMLSIRGFAQSMLSSVLVGTQQG